MAKRPVAVLFYGAGPLPWLEWGGSLTCPGLTYIRDRLAMLGFTAYAMTFGRIESALAIVREANRNGQRLLLGGMSLGVTTATLIQTTNKCDLLQCMAASKFAGANNRPVNHAMTKRSVLWANPASEMSGAGLNLGFDEIISSEDAHLLFDLDPRVIDKFLENARTLL